MRKNEGKISLTILIISLIIFIIIIGIVLLLFLKHKNTENIVELPNTNIETENNVNYENQTNEQNTDNVKIIEDNMSFENLTNEQNTVNNEKKYDILTDEINDYIDKDKSQTFRIQDVIHNSNGTITIKGRVYKYLDLPKLTKTQYDALQEGKSLYIFGEKATKELNDERAQEAGYDISLIVETKDSENETIYYANKNEDGSATLYYGSDTKIAEGTNVYLQITLNNGTSCEINEQDTTIEKYYTRDIHLEDRNRTRLNLDNTEFVFENGQCWLVRISEI